MLSATPKVLHPIAGLPMLAHVVEAACRAGADSIALVAGAGADAIQDVVSAVQPSAAFFEQATRLGTAHAVLAARDALAHGHDDIIVLFGDTPLVSPETLNALRRELAGGADLAVLGFRTENPDGYGRLLVENGQLLAIREHRDAGAAELAVKLCNGGIMGFAGGSALADLDAIRNDNAKGEFYLTDLVEVVRSRGGRVVALEAEERELIGVNNRAELARAECLWQERRRNEVMLQGATLHSPETVFLSHDTVIGRDCEIEPNVYFGQGVVLAEGVTIRAFSHLEGCRIATGAVVGPFARIRPRTEVGGGAKVGNFCELKNARVAEGAKINHLSYVGDASIGAGTNIGAGTITCNYDGYAKYRTEIGKEAFIGSNSALVAPVTIGDGAYVASGSVIVDDVPANSLAVARGRQAVKPGYAARIRERATSGRN